MIINKVGVCAIVITLNSGFVSAAQADDVNTSLIACRAKADNMDRLRCYDELSRRLIKTANDAKVVSVEKPVPQLASTPSAATITMPPSLPLLDSFGLPDKPAPIAEVQAVQATVAKVDQDPFKKLIVTMDIGQVWQQIDDARMRVREGDNVVLERGALGSFLLGVQGKSKRMRVKRIK